MGAWFKINGEQQWSKKGHRNNGKNGCGKGSKDELWNVNVKDLMMKGRILTMEIGTSNLGGKRDEASWGIKDFKIKLECEGCGAAINRSREKVKALWKKKHLSMSAKVEACNKQIDARKKQLAHHKKRSDAQEDRAKQCKNVFESYKKERNAWMRQRDGYTRERDIYRKKRDNFRSERDNYKKEHDEAKSKGSNVLKECERKSEERDKWWTNRLKNRNAEWEKKLKGMETSKSESE